MKEQFDGIDLIPAMNEIQNPSTRTLYFRFCDQAAIRQGDKDLELPAIGFVLQKGRDLKAIRVAD